MTDKLLEEMNKEELLEVRQHIDKLLFEFEKKVRLCNLKREIDMVEKETFENRLNILNSNDEEFDYTHR